MFVCVRLCVVCVCSLGWVACVCVRRCLFAVTLFVRARVCVCVCVLGRPCGFVRCCCLCGCAVSCLCVCVRSVVCAFVYVLGFVLGWVCVCLCVGVCAFSSSCARLCFVCASVSFDVCVLFRSVVCLV